MRAPPVQFAKPVGTTHKGAAFPNGWPIPTFMGVSEQDGVLTVEWCFGEQGAADSWRVLLSWDREEGLGACITTRTFQDYVSGEADVLATLDAWLRGPPKEPAGDST